MKCICVCVSLLCGCIQSEQNQSQQQDEREREIMYNVKELRLQHIAIKEMRYAGYTVVGATYKRTKRRA